MNEVTLLLAMTGIEQSTILMRTEAVRVKNLMRVQKISVTKNVTKCLQLVDIFKKEQDRDSSPLLVQCASEVLTFHGRITDLLGRLKSNMQKYLDISVQTFTGGGGRP